MLIALVSRDSYLSFSHGSDHATSITHSIPSYSWIFISIQLYLLIPQYPVLYDSLVERPKEKYTKNARAEQKVYSKTAQITSDTVNWEPQMESKRTGGRGYQIQ